MNNRNHSIDILRFVCSILVIFIHTDWRYYYEFLPVTRCAVPCFFIISGYLLFDKEKRTIKPERLKRSIIHVIKISFWATLFFIVWKELLYITSSDGYIWIPSIKSMQKWVFLNVHPFVVHLWYLFAYLYVLLIIMLVNKYNKWKQLYFFVPLLLAPHIILLLSNLNLSYIYVRNFLFTGLPFFAIGTMIKSKSNINVNKNKRNKVILITCIILFSITSILEKSFLLSVGKPAVRELYISSIILAICLFLLALSFENKQKTWLSVIGEKESLYIYIFHPVVIHCCNIIFEKLKLYELYRYVAPIIVLIVTMVLVKCFRRLKILK
jgi:surface polysaccharide O-acyltransferase-like enzyme